MSVPFIVVRDGRVVQEIHALGADLALARVTETGTLYCLVGPESVADEAARLLTEDLN